MKPSQPPIYRDCRRLLAHTEVMVRQFSRYHKYTVGTELRTQVMTLMRGVHRACFDKAQQVARLAQLRCHRRPYVVAQQTGWLRHGVRRREINTGFIPDSYPFSKETPHV